MYTPEHNHAAGQTNKSRKPNVQQYIIDIFSPFLGSIEMLHTIAEPHLSNNLPLQSPPYTLLVLPVVKDAHDC